MWYTGRAIQAAARIDENIKKDFAQLPNGLTLALTVNPSGPSMILGKNSEGKVKYLGSNLDKQKIDFKMVLLNIEAAIQTFTLQENTVTALMRCRMYVDGEAGYAQPFTRVMDAVEAYLLPKFIAKLAVKRYPSLPVVKKIIGNLKITFGAILGF